MKFHDFLITQILREINFGGSRNTKSAILTHLEALNFHFYEFLPLKSQKKTILDLLDSPKLISRNI